MQPTDAELATYLDQIGEFELAGDVRKGLLDENQMACITEGYEFDRPAPEPEHPMERAFGALASLTGETMRERIADEPRWSETPQQQAQSRPSVSTETALVRSAAIIREGWCTGAVARAAGQVALSDPMDPRAVSWCATGAIQKAAAELDPHWQETLIYDTITKVEVHLGGSLVTYNDNQAATGEFVAQRLEKVAGLRRRS